MIITATEFKTGFGRYLDSLDVEDILITKNGKIIAKLTKAEPSAVDQMRGFLSRHSSNLNIKKIKEQRLSEKYLGDYYD